MDLRILFVGAVFTAPFLYSRFSRVPWRFLKRRKRKGMIYMNFIKTNQYDKNFLKENMMGPNAMKILEEMSQNLKLEKGMRVLDLGCGRGLTSIFLAKEFGVTVFATDLWISPTDNFGRFMEYGVEDLAFPIYAEAHALPYGEEFFDAVISIDAYHYFGYAEGYLEKHIVPLVKKGGTIAITVPGLQEEFTQGIPEELQPFWQKDMHFHCCKWWTNLWTKSGAVTVEECKELECHTEAWQDWLECDEPHAIADIKMMEAEGGNYFNLVQIIAKVK